MVKIADLTIDPEIQLQARGTDYETILEYVEAIQSGSEFPPAKAVSDNGTLWLYDGFHRVEARRSLGIDEIELNTFPGTRTDALVLAAIANVLNGKPMNRAQKQEAGERLLRITDWPNGEIARRLAVDPKTVTNWAVSMEISRDTTRTVTRGDTTYTMDVSSIGQREPLGADKLPKAIVHERIEGNHGIVECTRCHNLYDGAAIQFCPYCAYTREQRVAYLQQKRQSTPHVSYNAGDNEWYTPQEFIDAARDVMGDIDLDPASTPEANEVVGARIFYTKEDNGLSRGWRGKVWMNPPYASELIGKFTSKLAGHIKSGRVTDAIVLVNNATETSWFFNLVSIASAICFPSGRVKFWAPNKKTASPLQGQAIIYIGNKPDRFMSRFREFGWTAMISRKS